MHPLGYLIDEIYHDYWGMPRERREEPPHVEQRRTLFGPRKPRRVRWGERR